MTRRMVIDMSSVSPYYFEETDHVGQVLLVLEVAQMAAARVDLGPLAEELPQVVKFVLASG